MRMEIKKLSVLLIALGVASPTFAVDCSNIFKVSIPNQQGGLTLSADVLYWRPITENLLYNYNNAILKTILPDDIHSLSVNTLEPSYHWGFDASIGYRIPCTGNDVTLFWTHLDQNRDSAFNDQTFNLLPSTNVVVANANSTVKYKYDAVDLDIGQKINFGDYFLLRIFAGARVLRLEQNRFIHNDMGVVNAELPFIILDQDQKNEFRGIGPQFGLNGHYCLASGFGLYADTTVSALIGRDNNDLRQGYSIFTPGLTTQLHVDGDRKTRFVPALDVNGGIDYTYNFNNCSRSSAVVQFGYKVIYYWNAVNTISNDIFATDPAARIDANRTHNVSFDGPYLGLKINL